MTRQSLRLRLLLVSAVSIVAALVVAGFGLALLFEAHVERRAASELDNQLRQIAGNLTFAAGGAPELGLKLADPRFAQPYSGLYWQVQEGEGPEATLLRSRSLWDQVLPLPADELARGEAHSHRLPGPGGSSLLVQERQILYSGLAGGEAGEARRRLIRIAVALDRAEIERATHEFAEDAAWALALLALVLVLAAWAQVRVGLSPLEALRQGLGAVRDGRQRRLQERYPDEVQPLVAEVNELLEEQERGLERARSRAADLAHGLKTPLTVLAGDARKLRARGEAEIAEEIESLALTMRRHVERELIRLPLPGARTRRHAASDLAAVLKRVVATLKRTPRGEGLDWRLDLDDGLWVGLEEGDLTEVVGSLLENASQWARAAVTVSASLSGRGVRRAEAIALVIADDGPGVPEAELAGLVERGRRLDENRAGSGLGLAIVSDILEAYGGGLELANGPDGGLRVELSLPPGASPPVE